jgi:hypothetical protein
MNNITILAETNKDRIIFRDKLKEFGIKSRVLDMLCDEITSGLPIYLTLYLNKKKNGKWDFQHPSKETDKLKVMSVEEFKTLTKNE